MKVETLNDLMQIKINGPSMLEDKDFMEIIDIWN